MARPIQTKPGAAPRDPASSWRTPVYPFIHRHETAKLKDVATGLGVKSPTLGEVVKDLVQKRWVTNRRAHHDDRVLCLRLSHTGVELIRRIMGHLPNLKKDFASSKGQ